MENATKIRRAKGMGSLILRSGVWYAKWQKDGIAKMQSTGIRVGDRRGKKDDRELAEEWLADKTEPLRMRHREDGIAVLMRQLMTDKERMENRLASAMPKMTLGELADAFRDSPRRPDCSEAMLNFYCGVVRRMAEDTGPDRPVAEFGEDDANAYAKSVGQRMAGGTFNKAMNALTLVWRIVGREAGLEQGQNPWVGIARKRADVHVRRPFTRKETDAILAAAEGEMRTLVAVCLYTGLRLGDACLFRWEDIRGDAAYVLTAKRDRKVGIPLHPRLREILGKVKARGYVMPGLARRYTTSAHGKPYAEAREGASEISRSVKHLIEKCGIATSVRAANNRKRPDATAHSLRHTFVTRAIEAGVPPYAVQAIVGHASATMTERYTHLSDKAVLEAFKKVE